MKAILTTDSSAIDAMHIAEVPEVTPAGNEVRIRVHAAGVNRADLLQREGKYPPPPGASDLIGLEVAGVVVETGVDSTRFKPGDRVMALLTGGGYAQYAVVDEGSVLPIPDQMHYSDAAGIMEVFLTAYQALFELAHVRREANVLIHAGGSGVGTAAIQLARKRGCKVFITAGSDKKIAFCEHLGANLGINYRTNPDFQNIIKEHTGGHGADVIIDFVGAKYISKNIDAAAVDGKIVMLAFMSGAVAEVNLAKILMKRITYMGSTLRARTNTYKAQLVTAFYNDFYPSLVSGDIKPVIDSVVPWEQVSRAHQRLEANANIGKVILQIIDNKQ